MAETAVKIDMATYLTFTLAGETFGVDVSYVREVLDLIEITKVPRTPEFMRGVINLRGGVVPVLDLRKKFGMPEMEDSLDTCVIVIEAGMDSETILVGAVADSVKEVFSMDREQIEPIPRIGDQLNSDFILGMGRRDGRFVMVLDPEKVLSQEELSFSGTAGDLLVEAESLAGKEDTAGQ